MVVVIMDGWELRDDFRLGLFPFLIYLADESLDFQHPMTEFLHGPSRDAESEGDDRVSDKLLSKARQSGNHPLFLPPSPPSTYAFGRSNASLESHIDVLYRSETFRNHNYKSARTLRTVNGGPVWGTLSWPLPTLLRYGPARYPRPARPHGRIGNFLMPPSNL